MQESVLGCLGAILGLSWSHLGAVFGLLELLFAVGSPGCRFLNLVCSQPGVCACSWGAKSLVLLGILAGGEDFWADPGPILGSAGDAGMIKDWG